MEYYGWPVLHMKNEKAKPKDDDDGSKNQAERQIKKKSTGKMVAPVAPL